MSNTSSTTSSFYSHDELLFLGLGYVGKEVKLSRKVSLYGEHDIILDDYCRVDDFCILSGKIRIGKYVHIAAYCGLFAGKTGIEMDDFSGLSSRCSLYAESDDYSGNTMVNPTIPEGLRRPLCASIYVGRYAVVGATSVLLPSVHMSEGSALAAMSLLKNDTLAWKIYGGVPAKPLKDRAQNILSLASNLPATQE